jgi:penicillin-binding protein 1B
MPQPAAEEESGGWRDWFGIGRDDDEDTEEAAPPPPDQR